MSHCNLTVRASLWVVSRRHRPDLCAFWLLWRHHWPVTLVAVIWWSPDAQWLKITWGNCQTERQKSVAFNSVFAGYIFKDMGFCWMPEKVILFNIPSKSLYDKLHQEQRSCQINAYIPNVQAVYFIFDMLMNNNTIIKHNEREIHFMNIKKPFSVFSKSWKSKLNNLLTRPLTKSANSYKYTLLITEETEKRRTALQYTVLYNHEIHTGCFPFIVSICYR